MSIKIYKITNRLNWKIYVGQTKNKIERRFIQHFYSKSPLGQAMRECGIENFTIEIIEECENQEQANERERFWIKVLKCKVPNGYNRANGGGGYEYRNRNYEIENTNFIAIGIIQKALLGNQYPILGTIEHFLLKSNLAKTTKFDFLIKTEISRAKIEWAMEIVPTSLTKTEDFFELLFATLYVQSEKLSELRYSAITFDHRIFNLIKEVYKNVTVDDYISVILLDNKEFTVADEFVMARRNTQDNVKSIFI